MKNRSQRRKIDKVTKALKATPFGPCPDCGTPLNVAQKPDGGLDAVLHVMPMCVTFKKLDAGAFITWVIDVREAERRTQVSV